MIYFLRAHESGRVKIGHTDRPVADRVRELQTGSPDRLSLIGTMRGDQRGERSLHARFAESREHGEWFRPTEDLMGFIAMAATDPRLDLVPPVAAYQRGYLDAARRLLAVFHASASADAVVSAVVQINTTLARLVGESDGGKVDCETRLMFETFLAMDMHSTVGHVPPGFCPGLPAPGETVGDRRTPFTPSE